MVCLHMTFVLKQKSPIRPFVRINTLHLTVGLQRKLRPTRPSLGRNRNFA